MKIWTKQEQSSLDLNQALLSSSSENITFEPTGIGSQIILWLFHQEWVQLGVKKCGKTMKPNVFTISKLIFSNDFFKNNTCQDITINMTNHCLVDYVFHPGSLGLCSMAPVSTYEFFPIEYLCQLAVCWRN